MVVVVYLGVGGGDVVMAAGGGSVQWMESEEMREMVNEVATVLDKATHIVYPENYQVLKRGGGHN